MVKTKKTELLFLALFIKLLRTGGRAAVVVPDGVLFGSSKAHKDIRRALVEEHKLEAIIKLPSAGQMEFIDMLIDFLSETGIIDPRIFYESPFTDLDDQALPGLPHGAGQGNRHHRPATQHG